MGTAQWSLKPVPVSAVYNAGPHNAVVTFDRPLQPGVLDPGNWFFRWANWGYPANNVGAAGTDVTIWPATGSGQVGPSIVNYTPPPFDVLSVPGQPADAFSGFPLT